MVTLFVRWLMAFAALWPALFAGASLSWQPWVHLPGVFDIVARGDGQLVVNTGAGLYLLNQDDGRLTPFARGARGYSGPAGAEAYIDVSPGLHVSSANCDFARDDVFVLRPGKPIGLTRVDSSGNAANFVSLSGIDSLNGIAFDGTGRFDHRLLVTAPRNGHTAVIAVDCKGHIQHITDTAPTLEGGLAVAPDGFGIYAGDLIAPDELTGKLWAIGPTGAARLMLTATIRHGQDTGVESEGFVPSGFKAGGWAYAADRLTAGNPHPGTDSILRLTANELRGVGVEEGDLLVAAEGGEVTVDVRCQATCTATTVVPIETTAHGEGHIAMVAAGSEPTTPPTPTPPTPPTAATTVVVAHSSAHAAPWLLPLLAALAAAGVVAVAALLLRARRH